MGRNQKKPEDGPSVKDIDRAIESMVENDEPMFKIITYADAGRQIGKTRETIRRWANEGLIPICRHPSGLPGIRQADFDELYGVAKKLHSQATAS